MPGPNSPWALEEHNTGRGIKSQRDCCPHDHRWRHGWQNVPGLYRAGSCPGTEARRYRGSGQPACPQGSGIGQLLQKAGATLRFLPPYSPDFNPIENAISQIKSILKKIAARTKDALDLAIAEAIEAVTPHQAENYFNAAGYECDTV
jgi:hypothetical protein